MTRLSLKQIALLLPAMLALVVGRQMARANDVPRAPEPFSPPTARELGDWVRDLGDPAYAVRDKAQDRLSEAGEAAIEHVERAVAASDPEVRRRGLEILSRHAISQHEPIGTKARLALEDLAKSSDSTVARAAEAAMAVNDRKRREAEMAKQMQQRMVAGRAVLMPARPLVVARARAVALGAGATSLQISVINGKRSVVAEADGQKVEINDGGDDGIKMSITKKVDGKDVKKSFAAKDAEELKAKHADAFQVYEKYTKSVGKAAAKAAKLVPPVEHTDVPRVPPMPPR